VIERVAFEVRTEAPTPDHYRHDWVPAPGVTLGGIWGPAVVTAEDGQWYFGLRGWSDFVYGMTHTVSPVCGFRALQPGLDVDPPHLYPEYAGIDWMEPYDAIEADGRSTLTYDSGRVEREAGASHWYDASGRWELHGTAISDIFVVHVPVQAGVDQEVYYRHELLMATGTVDGKQVEGYLHQDFAYGPPGTTYVDLPIARHLYGMWVSWIHEDADGEPGGGCFWQGRDGITFGPGYLLDGGKTTAHDDITATAELNASGQPTQLDVSIGGQSFRFDLDMSGSPLHFFGRVVEKSAGRDIAKSWCWVEYAGGMMTPEILDAVTQKYRLARRR
jgi:hypothetical protein